ncbi:MAG: exodeoxyribonuclease VII large subunit, partial [Alphaproteobacteria bacterium]|nr:exodeoxyribonuclease VII large subunit [Alphaproteobacteria bacterium]
GFALVRDASGHTVMSARAATPGSAVQIEFADGAVGATIDADGKPVAPASAVARRGKRGGGGPQGDLF